MKSILYIIIVVMVGSIIAAAIPMCTSQTETNIKIKCTTNNADKKEIEESVEIIKDRLKSLDISKYEIEILNGNTISISFFHNNNLENIQELITAKGDIEFYETFSRADVLGLLDQYSELLSILDLAKSNEAEAILGYCKLANKDKVDKFLANYYVSRAGQEIKFAWSKFANANNYYSLYLLKNKSFLDEKDVKESTATFNKEINEPEISITFNPQGGDKFAEYTRNNIGQYIAIVIDNDVYYAPKIMSEITGGQCMITGNFTFSETSNLASLIANGKLPIQFSVVK